MPETLFHYTSVEALAMILKGKSIRFSPLTMMEDMQEEANQDKQKYAKFVYVSSWTDLMDESIPMWNMYASMSKGVRIEMPYDMFCDFSVSISAIKERFPGSTVSGSEEPAFRTILPFSELLDMPCIPMPYVKEGLLKQVIYTNDNKLLNPIVSSTEGTSFNVNMEKIGKYKSKAWEFQSEWRFSVWMSPFGLGESFRQVQEAPVIVSSRMQNPQYELPFRYFSLQLSDEALKKMKITLSPKISDANRVIVSLLREKYNPTLTVSESSLYGTIR